MEEGQDFIGIPGGQKDSEGEDILITPRLAREFVRKHGLNRDLRPKHLFAFGMGAASMGIFGLWVEGFNAAGAKGLAIAAICLFFVYFIYFAVLTQFVSAFPFAGGTYGYARQGLGNLGGYLTGVFASIQYIGITALVLLLLRKFLSFYYPQLNADLVTFSIYGILLSIHSVGIWLSGVLGLVLTGSALSGLILFFLGTSEYVNARAFFTEPVVVNGAEGLLTALSVAIWFYLGLETITFSAEETSKPQRDLPLILKGGLIFAFLISLSVIYFGAGSIAWPLEGNSRYPLLTILSQLYKDDYVLISIFTVVNLTIFIASLPGLINGYSRQIYALSRAGYLPRCLSKMHISRQTPYAAILGPGLLAMLISYLDDFKILPQLVGFSAIFVQVMVLFSFLKLRRARGKKFCPGNLMTNAVLLAVSAAVLIVIGVFLLYSELAVGALVAGVFFIALLYYYLYGGKYISLEAPEEAAALSTERRPRVALK